MFTNEQKSDIIKTVNPKRKELKAVFQDKFLKLYRPIFMKAGEFKVKPSMEEDIWMDRKRLTIFALPISFTQYRLTETRIFVQTGILNTREEEIALFRVRDVSMSQSLFERLNGTGTVTITSTDSTTPVVKFEHIKDPRSVKELLSQMVDKSRNRNRVRAVEGISGEDTDGDGHPDDMDGDGIPDGSPNEGIFDA